MDYIEQLKKFKNELLESKDTNGKMPTYKLLAYEKALKDFEKLEYQDFCSKVIGEIGSTEPDKPLEINFALRALATGLVDENTTFGELKKK